MSSGQVWEADVGIFWLCFAVTKPEGPAGKKPQQGLGHGQSTGVQGETSGWFGAKQSPAPPEPGLGNGEDNGRATRSSPRNPGNKQGPEEAPLLPDAWRGLTCTRVVGTNFLPLCGIHCFLVFCQPVWP